MKKKIEIIEPTEPTKPTKEVLINLIRSKAVGLFDAEPRAGLSLSQVEKLVDEILVIVNI